MSNRTPLEALALAVGPTRTTALLIEPVDGQPRLVAVGRALTSTFGPSADAVAGARAAVAQVESAIGRPLFALGALLSPRREDSAGVETTSVVIEERPTVTLVGFGDRDALSSARRALAEIDARTGEPLEIQSAADAAELADRLRPKGPSGQPAAIVMVGPADAPAMARLAEALQLAWTVAGTAPPLLWTGEAAGVSVARAVLAPRFDFRVVDPVRPSAATEHVAPLRDAIVALWRARLDDSLPGAGAIAKWTPTPVQPWRRGEEIALTHLAETRKGPVWLARLVGPELQLLYAEPGQSDAPCVVATARADVAHPERQVRPWGVPTTAAAAHELRQAATDALRGATTALPRDARPSFGRRPGLLVAGGDLALLSAADLAHALADGLEPTGLVQIAVDEADGLAALGGLAAAAPAAAGPVLRCDLLRPLGALVAPGWRTGSGGVAFRFQAAEIDGQGGASAPLESAPVSLEETRRVPLGEGRRALVRAERPNWWDPRRYLGRKLQVVVEGGPLGLLLDGRARPAATALSLGRDTIEDDAAAPATMNGPSAARPLAGGPLAIRRTRALPAGARLLVAPGEAVEPDELVAQAPGRGDGANPALIPAGKLLGVADPRQHLVRPAGSRVQAGEVVARRKILFGVLQRTVVAPIDGVLATGLGGFGNLAVVPASDGLGIAAHLPGVVVGKLEDAVVIETRGALVSGALGFGGERRGTLLPPAMRLEGPVDARTAGRMAGAVVALDVLDRAQLERLRAAGACGAIVGSVEPGLAAELAVVDPGLAIVATEGIGHAPLPAAARQLLARHAGGLACLSAGRADDPRGWPEAILPGATAERALNLAEPTVAPGGRVRIVGEPVAHGRIAALLSAPVRLPSGAVVAAAEVDLDTGERVRAPLANLELV
ncbi:MAG TPA: hypothetical protein VGM69_21935 [Chloroflexota bacterium]|jgi:hypothetical protein